MLEDRRLSTDDSARLVDVEFLGVIEPREAAKRDAVELKVAGVTPAPGGPAAHAVAHAVVAGDQLREPAERAGPAEGAFLAAIVDEKGEVAVLGGEFAGENAGVAGAGVAEEGIAALPVRKEIRHEG